MTTEKVAAVSVAWALLGAFIVTNLIIPHYEVKILMASLNNEEAFDYLSTRSK